MEELIKQLNEMLAKEENLDVKTGLRMAKLAAMTIYTEELTNQFKKIKSN